MSFDGREHRSTPLIYPAQHHPKSAHTGIVYSRSLQTAYCSAQFSCAKVLERWASFDMRRGGQRGAQEFDAIAAGYRRVLGTHLVAEVLFASVAFGRTPKASHRISAVGNSITVNGDTVTTPIDSGIGFDAYANYSTQYAKAYGEFRRRDTFAGDKFSFSSRCEVELDPDQIDFDLQVIVEGYAFDDATSVVIAYYPLHIAVFQEFR